MILVAPDKYRGTMSASKAAHIISKNIREDKIVIPMADGGEGTAMCIASLSNGWEAVGNGVFFNKLLREMALDSSTFVGYHNFPDNVNPFDGDTAPLALMLNDLWKAYRPRKIYIGVGGTATCDGGKGLLSTLDTGVDWSKILVGLIDVKVPLLPPFPGSPSTLDFCKQKGFTADDMPRVEARLKAVTKRYGPPCSPFDGAGGGLGYALASVIKAECFSGAEWILENARIPWHRVTAVVTGEGRYDSQSACGKVVDVLASIGERLHIPVFCLAGCVETLLKRRNALTIIDLSEILAASPLLPDVAERRLDIASEKLARELQTYRL